MTASRFTRLSPQRRELLQSLLQERGFEPAAADRILRRPAGESTPLSFAQRRLWLVDQLEPGSATYNVYACVRLQGQLDVSSLARSLAEVGRRHEILRTTIAQIDGVPFQQVAAALPAVLPVIDLRAIRSGEAAARRLAVEEAARPFDLAADPLFRSSLLRLREDEHYLLLTLHHIVADGWSIGVLMREIGALYSSLGAGESPALPDLSIQYGDFSAWQHQWLTGERLDRELVYWRERLAGSPESLDLPTDRPRPRVRTSRGRSESVDLSPEPWGAVVHLAQRNQATPFMVLLSAFAVLLYRYSGQCDIAVGTPVVNRQRPETVDLIGFFTNTLVLRIGLESAPTFQELLDRVRQLCLAAYAHQDLPFELLVGDLRTVRDTSRSPVFQTLFALQNAPVPELSLPGLALDRIAMHNGTAKFDLTLLLEESSEGLRGELEHSADLFDATTAARMARHFRTSLQAAMLDQSLPVSRLPLLSPEEVEQLLHQWNDTERLLSLCKGGLHGCFEAAVSRRLGAEALSWGAESLSYEELNCRANRLAHYLRSCSVGPESVVGLCMDRTPDMVVAMLGILKAGGAYLPLDPAYPRERLELMIGDTCSGVVVAKERWLDALSASQVRAVCLDRDAAEISARDNGNPKNCTLPQHLAYLIYTSGSLGRPKAVMVEHRSAVALVRWSESFFSDEELDGVLASTSISFDLSVFELFVPLCRGGRVVLAANALDLPRAASAAVVRLLDTVPSALAALLRDGGLPASVRTVNVAGEVLVSTLAEAAYHQPGVRRVLNLYGPSEDTTYSTFYEVPRGTDHAHWIGRPVENTCAYVLDGAGQPVPIGIPGELFLGGEGLARGYFARPELTAERFVPDALGTLPGGRLYRTGDRVRWRAGGFLEFLGRIDHQIKIRGFRIEPGEVEAALVRHPAVSESVVVAREDEPGDLRLVAYIACREEEAPAWRELRVFLKVSLPELAVPSAAVFLSSLPRLPNGKVDRKRLPVPEGDRAGEVAFAAPHTTLEELLAGIWSDVLRLDRVGVHDNFFELGGHSLLGTQLLVRLRQALSLDLPLSLLFEAPTVARLAACIEPMLRNDVARQPPIVPVPRVGELPLSFAQQRLWFLDQLQPNSAAYNMSYGVRLRGGLNEPALRAALDRLVARHEALRTTFQDHGGRPFQEIAPASETVLPRIDLDGLPPGVREAELRRLGNEEVRRPFDLSLGPLLRGVLLHLGPAEHVVVLAMHHIVSDGWSLGVLIEEIVAFYGAAVCGGTADLPPLPVQYADFAVWQRSWLQGEELERLLGGWRGRLAGLPGLELPADRPRPGVETFRGEHWPVALSPRLTAALVALGRRRGATLFMVLLTAFNVLLHRYTNQDDLSVGAPVANRNQPGLEGLIGFFANTLVLRTSLAGNPGLGELLARVRESALAAYAGQDLPFEKLVEELRPQRDMSHNPLFQVMLVLQNQARPALRLPGLELVPFYLDTGTAKLDLTLFFWPDGEGLGGAVEHNTDLFDRTTLRRWIRHLEAILEEAAERPDQRLWDFALLDQAERHQILIECNEAAAEPPATTLVHELFAAAAARVPERIALVDGTVQLTYAEVARRAALLARQLAALGVAPDVPVGVCLERGWEMGVALLAVLKAGGCYLPLDPDYPRERLAFMLEDARSSVVISRLDMAAVLPSNQREVVWVEGGRPRPSVASTGAPERQGILLSSEHLAYIVYTSGSTGRPKGVAVPHRVLSNLIAWQLGDALRPMARTLQFASPSFDASVHEVFATWAAGGTLVVATAEQRRDPRLLLAWAREQQIERLFLPFVALQQLAEAAAEETELPPLVEVQTAGEQLQVTPEVKALFRRLPGCALHNHYGPSETHVVTAWTLTGDPAAWPTLPPIGRPLSATAVHLLDRYFRPVPVGVPGELYAGGSMPGRGYLGQPERTAERFVPDPFGAAGGRLYRTGDLARRRPGGEIEFLGRLDNQVKVRGFRVEPGEIEAALAAHPAVRAAAVVAVADSKGGRRLVAGVVGEGSDLAGSLRTHLRERLPDYMVPAAFVVLPSLPLTGSGKVDRLALAKQLGRRDALGETGASVPVAARTPVEEVLAAIWAEVLEIDRVGIHDSFFDLGGHSLLATQLISRVRSVFRQELPVRTIFEAVNVADLAKVIAKRESVPGQAEKIARLYQRIRSLDPQAVRARLQENREPVRSAP